MKRILIFSLAYYPSFVSGAEAAIKEITDRISTDEIEFHMLTLLFDKAAPREERIGSVTIHRLGFGGKYLSKILFVPLAALQARRMTRTKPFDAMWAMMTYMLFPVVLARALGVRAPHILTLQDGDPYEKVFGRWFIKPVLPLLNYGFRTAARIQVISAYLGTWPSKRGYTGPIELIHNGANPRDLKDQVRAEEIAQIHAKFGKKAGDIWLVNTARLVHQKGNDDTIRALQELPEQVKFLIVGGGPDEQLLKDVAQESGVTDRVLFAGPVDRSLVSAYRKAADIFVGPSRSEGLGNAFLSAMASRLPVVTTQEGGLAEFVFDEGHNPDVPPTAWVVRKDCSPDIAAAVKDILAHPEKVEKITANARAMVVEKYDWDQVAQQMKARVFDPTLNGQ
ncbi:MAG TPA: glycosyltransferase family 4 protein [Candidatus Paceibacterota bacterium]|nr:glycosyltransferase family 4 protein [Candidatus Paceibacterota bacterium]